ncbi:MAG TPA: hypothetical protein VFQ07_08210, partial [Candidatus Polarisedimenticolia bacterium]|nr:hypothetical protein [Candidatus Polarisedimenticolia bacterium]
MARERRHGWWTMSARLFGRSLGRRGATFFVALVAVAGGSAVAATMLTLKADLRAKMTRELRRYGENLAIVPAEDRPGATLDEAAVRRALGDAAAPVLLARGEVAPAGPREPATGDGASAAAHDPATGEGVAVLGVDFAAHRRLHASWRVDGDWPQGGDEALLGAAAARRLGLGPGDRAT